MEGKSWRKRCLSFLLCPTTRRWHRNNRHKQGTNRNSRQSSNGMDRLPTIFCPATETARDNAETLNNWDSKVNKHPLEHYCVPPKKWKANTSTNCTQFINQLVLYIDDFILISQCQSKQEMMTISRKVLHAIHSVFPPPICYWT